MLVMTWGERDLHTCWEWNAGQLTPTAALLLVLWGNSIVMSTLLTYAVQRHLYIYVYYVTIYNSLLYNQSRLLAYRWHNCNFCFYQHWLILLRNLKIQLHNTPCKICLHISVYIFIVKHINIRISIHIKTLNRFIITYRWNLYKEWHTKVWHGIIFM